MSIRTERVASMLQRELADIIRLEFAGELSAMITVTGVRVSGDLGIAYVHVSVYGDSPGEKESAISELKALGSRIRGSLGRRIRHQLKGIPELRFVLDDSLAEAARLDELFGQIHDKDRSPDGAVVRNQS